MRLSRQSRVLAALVALVSMLFTQLAVASYACPRMQIANAMESVAASVAAVDHHEMSGCEGMDTTVKPLVCHDHGQTRDQSLDKPELPNVPPFMATMLVQTVTHADHPTQSVIPPTMDLFLTRTTAPPLSIRNCCFRI
jgi:hypothetical protein